MAVRPDLTELERFLETTPNDTEDAPWMVMSDLQVLDVELLRAALRLHIERRRLPWYMASYLKIVGTRPGTGDPLEAAPDLLLAEAETRLRTLWSIAIEGKAPEFVLEVAAESSWTRDTSHKPRIYDWMGVGEYAIFAPERGDSGPVLFGYRRDEGGRWADWRADGRGVLWARALGGFGLAVEEGRCLRALDADGVRLPLPRELVEEEAAGRAAAERERLAAEQARAAAERDRDAEAARREAAEEEAARLREELRRLREGRA